MDFYIGRKIIRPTHGIKTVLKEKFVEIYENFFKGNDPSEGNPNFWSELFLLRNNIRKIFLKAVETLKEENTQRKINAIETLYVLLQGIFTKKFNNFSFEVINLLTGLDNADVIFPQLVDGICSLLKNEETVEIKVLALHLTIIIICGNNNINQNSINVYFMKKDIFDPLIGIIVSLEMTHIAYEAIVLLVILANYNKYESKNPYLLKISEIKDEIIFQKIVETIGAACLKCRKQYTDIQDDYDTYRNSIHSALSYVGTFLTWHSNKPTTDYDPELSFDQLPSANISILLALYDFSNNNKKFITYISKTIMEWNVSDTDLDDKSITSIPDDKLPPITNFLSFSSYLLQHNPSSRAASYSKMTLLIITILSEDSTFIECICDERRNYNIRLCRQRLPILPCSKSSQPLVCAILDICIGFINHNMKKKLATDLHSLTLGIIHKLICHLKRMNIRLTYHWTELWHSLIGLLKFILSNHDEMNHDIQQSSTSSSSPSSSIDEILIFTINIINLCITFGDSFLPDTLAYDNLFYELVRYNEVFDGLHGIIHKQSSSKDNTSQQSQKRSNSSQPDILANIMTICQHFHLKIEAWKLTNHVKSLLPEQVFEIISKNFDTLELVTPEKLDYYISYSEIPYYVPFFKQVLRLIVDDFKRRQVLLD
ncbi:hypothetical protein Glove_851g9 [Diversispora epigaea]|uniref:Armadillo-like helical domain-containing protein n=1 Tax=Diversispora epigaea TaxID=1348612 RepID=A0A397G6X1_9GLOM|nr:hypothetical protein Glove_851g9 [Diversispora epigaea]